MIGQLLLRAALGGAIVSIFAVAGEIFKPKTFAGVFGSAPSVGIASLALTSYERGSGDVSLEARSMIIGAVGLFFYGVACVLGTRRTHWPVWVGAALSWSVWFGVALTLFLAGRSTGVLR